MSTVSRAFAVLLASLTAVFGVAIASPAAAQTVDEDPPGAAASWLAGRFVDGNHLETVFDGTGYPDQGLTADAVLAFDGVGVAQDLAVAATDWLAEPDNVSFYAGNGTTDSYAGPLAKLALVAIAQGADPTDFGGVNLIDDLQARQADSGRFSDLSGFGDFSNAITQSLAVISLLRAGEDAADGAGYLAAAPCDDGGFPLQFEQPTCASQVDATGFAVQAMLAADLDASAALDYLEGAQQPSGGFGDSGLGGVANANSTALAAQALRVGGRTDAADGAVEYLLSLQVGCDGPTDQRGAIRYDDAGSGDTQRATAQGLLGLSGVGLFEVDNTDAAAAVPAFDCPAAPSSSPAPTTSAQAGPVPGGGAELPATGVRPLPATGVGALLVLVGFVLVLVARQRRTAVAKSDRQ